MMRFIAAIPLSLALAVALTAADWPQWRGPQRDGHAAGTSWPAKLDTNHDGKLTQEEVAYMGASQWKLCDADQNGSLTTDEFIREAEAILGRGAVRISP